MFKRGDGDNELDKSSPRFKARGNTSLNMSVTNPFGDAAMENNFIITPKRIRNIASPDEAFEKAHVISKAKAQRRSTSGEILEINIQSPGDEEHGKDVKMTEESEVLQVDVAPSENPFVSTHKKNYSCLNS